MKRLRKQKDKEMEELDKIWKEINEGKGESCTKKEFFKKLKEW
jgi:hypothetical protein